METLEICMVIGAIIGLVVGAFGGTAIHGYELNKCNSLSSSTNQEYYNYELQNDCYFVLEKTEWNLFLYTFILAIVGLFVFGVIGMAIGIAGDFY